LKKHIKEIFKFLISGGISALITLIILNILLLINIPLIASSMIGYGGGIISSFFLNKKWTFEFKDRGGKPVNVFIVFMLYNIIVMILFGYLNVGFLNLIKYKFISQILSIIITTLLNFTVYKFFIFKKA